MVEVAYLATSSPPVPLRGRVMRLGFGDEVRVSEGGRDMAQYPFSNLHEPVYYVGVGLDVDDDDDDVEWASWFRERELLGINALELMAEKLHEHDRLTFVRGDATDPPGFGPKVIVHICNNVGGWGAGFVVAISRRWPEPEAAYRTWFNGEVGFGLGQIQPVLVRMASGPLWVINMVAQHGVGSQNGPPIRYHELRKCLKQVVEFANRNGASVHMPRIGCGLAGGDWTEVEKIIRETLCATGVYVTVYDFGSS